MRHNCFSVWDIHSFLRLRISFTEVPGPFLKWEKNGWGVILKSNTQVNFGEKHFSDMLLYNTSWEFKESITRSISQECFNWVDVDTSCYLSRALKQHKLALSDNLFYSFHIALIYYRLLWSYEPLWDAHI